MAESVTDPRFKFKVGDVVGLAGDGPKGYSPAYAGRAQVLARVATWEAEGVPPRLEYEVRIYQPTGAVTPATAMAECEMVPLLPVTPEG